MKRTTIILFALCVLFNLNAVVYHNETHKVTHFDYSDYTVTYTDVDGVEHTVPITEKATTPEHMMALLRKVYRDETIPGIHYAYDYDGTQYRKIDYNTYGHLGSGNGAEWVGSKNDFYPNPLQDGMTLLLVQVRESWGTSYHNKTNNMREYFEKAYTSMQLVPKFTRVNNEQNPGYLFSIDGAANRFFFISKGKPRSTYTKPLFRTFEQISPVNAVDDAATISFIDSIRAGNPYYCFHDCTNVTSMTGGHWFTISKSGENYSLKNLSIFIPDRRFEYQLADKDDNWINSSYFNEYGNSQNPGEEDWTVMPQVFMYNVDLGGSVEATDEVPSGEENEGANYFKIKLNWEGSCSRINVPQHYYVYQIDESGNRTLLTTINAQPTMETSHEYLVKQKVESQVFHYIVTGAPINYDEDGSLLLDKDGNPLITISADSKICTLVVPGKEPFFTILLNYRSRYELKKEQNVYKNKISIGPNTTDDYLAIKNEPISLDLQRTDDQGNTDIVANVTFSYNEEDETYHYVLVYNALSQNTTLTFDDEQPVLSGALTDANSSAVVIDRFTASTADNDQSGLYTYSLVRSNDSFSNECVVPVYKTTNTINGVAYTKDEVLADTDRSLECAQSTAITFDALNKPLAHITQYDIYRLVGKSTEEKKVGKAENSDNRGNYCMIGLGSNGLNDVQGWEQVGENGGPLTLVDNSARPTDNDFRFVPVINTLINDEANTYGCNFQKISYPLVDIEVCDLLKTNPFAGPTGPEMGYLATLRLTPLLTDEVGNVYYYRVWRLMEEGTTSLEQEILLNTQSQAEGEQWGMSYAPIQSTYPGQEYVEVTDIFIDRVIRGGESKKVSYIVRMYATPHAAAEGEETIRPDGPYHTLARGAGKDYFVAENMIDVYFNDNVITSITDVNGDSQVVKVKYYNVLGIPSDRPYPGVNIAVYTLSNGITMTQKVIN